MSDPAFDDLRSNILHSLELHDGRYPNRQVTWRIVNDIVQGVWVSSLKLSVPIPRFGLIHGWDQRTPVDTKGRMILGRVMHFPDKSSMVEFSPSFIDNSARYFSGERPIYDFSPILPRQVAIHEMRHIWQHRYHRDLLDQDLYVYDRYGLDGWETTESEKDARGYAATAEYEIASKVGETNPQISIGRSGIQPQIIYQN